MYSHLQVQGGREYMEDVVDIKEKFWNDMDFYAVYDGHAGDKVAIFLKTHLRNHLTEYLDQTNGDVIQSLKMTFAQIANKLDGLHFAMQTGSAALVVVKNKKHVWVANCGDCRAIMKYFDGRTYKSAQITKDHKPNDPDERARIESVGGMILQDPFGTWRVNGNLALSRSFGDLYLAPAVTWAPEIYHFGITQDMRAVIMASDGIWDTVGNQEAVNIATHEIQNNMMYDHENVLQQVCKQITHTAQRKGSGDNISIIFILI
jgi:serine/threonine protein phosphatase PrpC